MPSFPVETLALGDAECCGPFLGVEGAACTAFWGRQVLPWKQSKKILLPKSSKRVTGSEIKKSDWSSNEPCEYR